MWPLTDRMPKGLLPVAGLPFVDMQLAQLRGAGVEEVLLAVGGRDVSHWQEFASTREGVSLVVESQPLDTAGPVRQAVERLDERFMVLNGDVIVESDLRRFLDSVPPAAEASLALVEVEDTSAYGVVVIGDDGIVARFVEKPPAHQAPAKTVNAGMYVMSKSAIASYEPGPLSFERVVFPDLVSRGELGGVVISGAWLDIGTPNLYLDCTATVLSGESGLHRPDGPHLIESDIAGSVGGGWCWVSPDVAVASGAVVEESVLLPGTRIEADAVVSRAIVGWDAEIGEGATVRGSSVVGAGASVGAGTELDEGIRIAPGAVLRPGDVTFSPPR